MFLHGTTAELQNPNHVFQVIIIHSILTIRTTSQIHNTLNRVKRGKTLEIKSSWVVYSVWGGGGGGGGGRHTNLLNQN